MQTSHWQHSSPGQQLQPRSQSAATVSSQAAFLQMPRSSIHLGSSSAAVTPCHQARPCPLPLRRQAALPSTCPGQPGDMPRGEWRAVGSWGDSPCASCLGCQMYQSSATEGACWSRGAGQHTRPGAEGGVGGRRGGRRCAPAPSPAACSPTPCAGAHCTQSWMPHQQTPSCAASPLATAATLQQPAGG